MDSSDSQPAPDWRHFLAHHLRDPDLGISLDFSRMRLKPGFWDAMQPHCERAFADRRALEAGGIANPDEKRRVGHYWLRNAKLAPPELRASITDGIRDAKRFAAEVHSGAVRAPDGQKFTELLCIGIGGSALGPQLVVDALVEHDAPVHTWFFDNTDPDGMTRVLAAIGDKLGQTLTVVTSKSGGTKETRNGMLEAAEAYRRKKLDFPKHAVAITGAGSKLDRHAKAEGWLPGFEMSDWVGGRTSLMSVVGLVPAALQAVDIDALLAGAAAMDEKTRREHARENLAMVLALMWHAAGDGKGAKDMVILPYKDRLQLLSKYLQQLIMESLGKKRNLDGAVVHQGIAVYGNKGSTDQHAYIQQLRDGLNNFFATFIEVRKSQDGAPLDVEAGASSGDFLQGFLRGTRSALWEGGRESITLSIPAVDAYHLGALIALYERAVSFYASLVNINAYHQPGVEAGKIAAETFLELFSRVRHALADSPGQAVTAEALASKLSADTENVYHILNHLASNDPALDKTAGATPAADRFTPANPSMALAGK